MNIPVIFQFLKDLSANNNREWFNEHKAEYETARAEFDNFLATVIARISLFDETIRGIQPKTVLIVFTGIPASLRIKHLIKYISEVYQCQRKEVRSLWILCTLAAGWFYACRRKPVSAYQYPESSATIYL